MSSWTYVRGFAVTVSYGNQKQKNIYLNQVIDSIPKATGSEGPIELITVQVPGYDSVAYVHNKKGDVERIVSQSQYYIVFHGNLRDREFKQTKDEVKKMLDEIAIYLRIEDIYVLVKGCDQESEFTDSAYYRNKHNSIKLPKFIKKLKEG